MDDDARDPTEESDALQDSLPRRALRILFPLRGLTAVDNVAVCIVAGVWAVIVVVLVRVVFALVWAVAEWGASWADAALVVAVPPLANIADLEIALTWILGLGIAIVPLLGLGALWWIGAALTLDKLIPDLADRIRASEQGAETRVTLDQTKVLPKSRLGGWHRLWIVISGAYLLVVVALWLIVSRDPVAVTAMFTALMFWAVPVTAVYAVGAAIGWIYRGFRETPDIQDHARRNKSHV